MRLDSVRELKNSLPTQLKKAFSAKLGMAKTESTAVAMAASRQREVPSFFLGITGTENDYRLALRLQDRALQLDPATAEWSFFEAPAFKEKNEPPGAYGIAVAGDGSVWFAENDADKMARLDIATGKVEEFEIPYEGYAMPRRMQSDANGDVWVALWEAGKLMKIDHKTRKMTIYNPPTPNNGAYTVTTDKTGRTPYIWFSEHKVDRMARFDPRNGQFVEFPLPYAESDARRVEIDPTNPNRIFFSGNTSDRIGFIEYLP